MTLQEIRKAIDEFKKRCGITYSKNVEEEADGEIKFLEVTLRFKVEKGEKNT